jgi:hypothetical protein
MFLDLRILNELRGHFSEVRILKDLAFWLSLDLRFCYAIPRGICMNIKRWELCKKEFVS